MKFFKVFWGDSLLVKLRQISGENSTVLEVTFLKIFLVAAPFSNTFGEFVWGQQQCRKGEISDSSRFEW